MNRIYSHLDEVNLIGKLADLKDDHYKNTLILNAIIEVLIDKKLITRQEISDKAAELDPAIRHLTHPIS